MAVIQKRNCDEKKECHYSDIKIRHETIKILRLTVKNIFMQIFNCMTESRKHVQMVVGVSL